MNRSINFDMDNTISALYDVEGWLEKLRAEDPSPYLEAEPMCDMEKLNEVLEKLRIGMRILLRVG